MFTVTVACINNVTSGYIIATVDQVTEWPIIGVSMVSEGDIKYNSFILEFSIEQGSNIVWDTVMFVSEETVTPLARFGGEDEPSIVYDSSSLTYKTETEIPGQLRTGRFLVHVRLHNYQTTVNKQFNFTIESNITEQIIICPSGSSDQTYSVDMRSMDPVPFLVSIVEGSSVNIDMNYGDGSPHERVYTGDLM